MSELERTPAPITPTTRRYRSQAAEPDEPTSEVFLTPPAAQPPSGGPPRTADRPPAQTMTSQKVTYKKKPEPKTVKAAKSAPPTATPRPRQQPSAGKPEKAADKAAPKPSAKGKGKPRRIPPDDRPTADQLRKELSRERETKRFGRVLRSTIYSLVVVAAAAVLLAVLVLPVFRIYGSSMNPTLTEGDIVVAVKGTDFQQGDLVVFYYENKVLVKRYIAGPGQWVDIDDAGNVYVDGQLLDEPYLTEKALGECDIELPYQVPDGRIFVLGDHRATSVDSRSTSVGCVAEEQLVGKIVFRVWPLAGFGAM